MTQTFFHKRRKFHLFSLATCGFLLLTACSQTPSLSSINLVCASVESYQSTKALVLVDAAQGGNAVDSVDGYVGALTDGLTLDIKSTQIFESYSRAMKEWALEVENYKISRDSSALSAAAANLESGITTVASSCKSAGWKFEPNWR